MSWHCRRQGQSGRTPVIYGLDCEMCETALDSRALVRVCVVDEEGKDVLDVSSTHSSHLLIHLPCDSVNVSNWLKSQICA